jgi:hypothetical protein
MLLRIVLKDGVEDWRLITESPGNIVKEIPEPYLEFLKYNL